MPDDAGDAPTICHRCGRQLSPGQETFYVVRIEAFADPTPPADTGADLSELRREIEDLIERMGDLSERELMDQVHRRLVLFLCASCYKTWIEDPVGQAT